MMNVKQEDDNDPRCKTGRFMLYVCTLLCLGEVCLCLRAICKGSLESQMILDLPSKYHMI